MKREIIIINGTVKEAYFSNTYTAFSDKQSFFKSNDAVNIHSALVYKQGECTYRKSIDYGLVKKMIQFENEEYCFIEKELENKLYIILVDLTFNVEHQPLNKIINLSSSFRKHGYGLINTYEAFMNYIDYHRLPVRSHSNDPFFTDFQDSLYSSDFNKYEKNDSFEFFTIENKNSSGRYFYFLVFDHSICLTDYRDTINVYSPSTPEHSSIPEDDDEENFEINRMY